jgi:hypothetical protein
MANKIDDTDRWNRGRKNPNRDGAGSYTESTAEALARIKRGNLDGDGGAEIDRASRPTGPAGSGHYPATKDG